MSYPHTNTIKNKIDGIIGGSEHFVKELPIQEVINYANQILTHT